MDSIQVIEKYFWPVEVPEPGECKDGELFPAKHDPRVRMILEEEQLKPEIIEYLNLNPHMLVLISPYWKYGYYLVKDYNSPDPEKSLEEYSNTQVALEEEKMQLLDKFRKYKITEEEYVSRSRELIKKMNK